MSACLERLGEQVPDPSLGAVGQLIERVRPFVTDSGQVALEWLLAVIQEPLRVAVAGRIKAGKSTLVNAFLRQRVAPTSSGECTRVVAEYRYGRPSSAKLILKDGRARWLEFTSGGTLPADFDVAADDVDRVEVTLPNAALCDLSLLDTPGLASLQDGHEVATRRAVLGQMDGRDRTGSALARADALVYVVRDVVKPDDEAFLGDLRVTTSWLGAEIVNSVVVLSHADLAGQGAVAGEDPFDIARAQAAEIAARRHPGFDRVLPVSGLLAETASTGALTAKHAQILSLLRSVDAEDLLIALRTGPDPGWQVNGADLSMVVDLIGSYGLVHARERAADGPGAITRWAFEQSGFSTLEHDLHQLFVRRTAAIRSRRVLHALSTLSGDLVSDGRRVSALVEEYRLSPELHNVAELEALHALRGESNVPAKLITYLESVSIGEVPAGDQLSEAKDWVARLRVASRHPAVAEAARVLLRSYELAARQ